MKKNLFTLHAVPTVLQFLRIVNLQHLADITVFETHSLHFFASQMARTPG